MLSVIAIGVVLGCSIETRTRLMHFFFEYPEAEPEAGAPEGPAGELAPDKPFRHEPVAVVASRHEPFVSRQCQSCHAIGQGQLPRSDFMEVCRECHESYFEYRRFVHAPVAAGDCQYCHVMHVAEHPALLASAQAELCGDCHEVHSVEEAARTYHRGIDAVACTACHDAHFGQTHLLLKPEELRGQAPEPPEPSGGAAAEP